MGHSSFELWVICVEFVDALFSAPDARHYFLLSCQKKVSKEKSRPQRRPAAPGSLRCSATTGGLRNSGFALRQSSPFFPVASCAARRRKGLIENRTHINRMWCQVPFGVLFLPPRAAPSSGVRPGAVGEDCLRAKPEFRSRPASRVAQGSRHSRPRNAGVAFSLATFFWRPKRKYARASGAETSVSATPRCDR